MLRAQEHPFVDPSMFRSNVGAKKNLLKRLTVHIIDTYKNCSHDFKYSLTSNPRRVLTKPSQAVGNEGHDNANSDYIVFVNDILGRHSRIQYQVLDLLGKGTFGQVVKAQNLQTKEFVAVKIIRNKASYFNQGLTEIQILETINNQLDSKSKHVLKLLDYFVEHNHLCLVFELLSLNLFELIKQNRYRGLSLTLIRCFLTQILDALETIGNAGIVHCDLKPENILLENLNSPTIKLIDFGSSCFQDQRMYSYVQSRFYRAPEVLVGLRYTSAIDVWSAGCISIELFLGLPIFPGSSEYNQISRITDMLGPFPSRVLENGVKSNRFFNRINNGDSYYWVLKSEESYTRDTGVPVPPSKNYFNFKDIPNIIYNYGYRDGMSKYDLEKERDSRACFIDFVLGLLKLDPSDRWTPEQAKKHPFITGEPFITPYIPAPRSKSSMHWTKSISPSQTQPPIQMLPGQKGFFYPPLNGSAPSPSSVAWPNRIAPPNVKKHQRSVSDVTSMVGDPMNRSSSKYDAIPFKLPSKKDDPMQIDHETKAIATRASRFSLLSQMGKEPQRQAPLQPMDGQFRPGHKRTVSWQAQVPELPKTVLHRTHRRTNSWQPFSDKTISPTKHPEQSEENPSADPNPTKYSRPHTHTHVHTHAHTHAHTHSQTPRSRNLIYTEPGSV